MSLADRNPAAHARARQRIKEGLGRLKKVADARSAEAARIEAIRTIENLHDYHVISYYAHKWVVDVANSRVSLPFRMTGGRVDLQRTAYGFSKFEGTNWDKVALQKLGEACNKAYCEWARRKQSERDKARARIERDDRPKAPQNRTVPTGVNPQGSWTVSLFWAVVALCFLLYLINVLH